MDDFFLNKSYTYFQKCIIMWMMVGNANRIMLVELIICANRSWNLTSAHGPPSPHDFVVIFVLNLNVPIGSYFII